jgi:hypothetical protein
VGSEDPFNQGGGESLLPIVTSTHGLSVCTRAVAHAHKHRQSKDIIDVIERSPAKGCYIGRFPNTRKLCGKVRPPCCGRRPGHHDSRATLWSSSSLTPSVGAPLPICPLSLVLPSTSLQSNPPHPRRPVSFHHAQALMTKLMRRAQTYAPVVRSRLGNSAGTPTSSSATGTPMHCASSGTSFSSDAAASAATTTAAVVRMQMHSRPADPSLQRLRETFLSFLPRTWIMPGDVTVLAKEMAAYSDMMARYTGRKVTYIVKPDGGACGEGIFLATTYQDIECVVHSAYHQRQKAKGRETQSRPQHAYCGCWIVFGC